MNYHKFAKIYSYSRTSRYLKAAKGNKKKAQEMFYANARLARSFQPLISFFEVVLRNQLHYALANHYNDVMWLVNQKTGFMSAPSLTHISKKTGIIKVNDFLKKEVERAEKVLIDKGRNITAGRVIAELNFGFWNSLFETHHYALLSGVPCTIFNGLPTGVGRKKINQKIQQTRKLRNRISHSEPLCFKDKSFDMTYVCDMYDIIHDFMSWINPNIVPTISKENLNQVKSEIAAIEVILKK
ncbi:MAG: Abi family protein [Prevotella sp.]|nr:Abi family protein [Prevotella sp.]MBR6188275.1 Abi family protein [Prevotella sp.]